MHYNADQLRDYHFGLIEEPDTESIKVHLESCAECRAELEQIRQQFAALDVLNEQPVVSAETVKSVLLPKRVNKIIPFRTAAILAAAASIALIFGIFQGSDRSPNGPTDRTAGVSPASSMRAKGSSPAPTLAELRAENPFAPASNIELNVLPRRDDVQLTIYNAEDLTLVREKRKLTLKRGWNWLQFMWSNTLIDPTSLSLEPQTHADRIEITQLVYPPRLNELARWTIFSEIDGEAEFELTYFTSGLKWNAFYEATLTPDEQAMQLRSFVRVDNGSGEDYENAQTRLVVGEINLVEPIAELARRPAYRNRDIATGYGRAAGDRDESWGFINEINDLSGEISLGETVDFAKQKEVFKQALSEYQLYTIEGRETIPDQWGKRLPSFDVQEIGVTNLYKFDEERWGSNTMRFLSFANTEVCQLGETPLPNGDVRVFGTGRDGSPSRPQSAPGGRALPLSYIGATGIKYIPVGEEVELELGTAQKVKVEPKLMRTRTENYEFLENIPNDDDDDPGPVNGDVSGWDEITNWKLELTNTRDLPVKLEITRATGSTDWEISTDTPFEKQDASHIRFTVTLEPRSKLHLEYELTVHHGTRGDRQDDVKAE